MASKSQTMFNGVQSGRVGAVVGFKRNNVQQPQGIRPFVQSANPKTKAQAQQRAKIAGASKFAGFLALIGDHNMEGQRIGAKNRSAFLRLLTKQGLIAAKGGTTVGWTRPGGTGSQLYISSGRLNLDVNVLKSGETSNLTADTIARAGLRVGDVLTAVIISLVSNSENFIKSGVTYIQEEVKVGQSNHIQIDEQGSVSFIIQDTEILRTKYVAVIVERNEGSKHLLNNAYFSGLAPVTAEQIAEVNATYIEDSPEAQRSKYLYGSDL